MYRKSRSGSAGWFVRQCYVLLFEMAEGMKVSVKSMVYMLVLYPKTKQYKEQTSDGGSAY